MKNTDLWRGFGSVAGLTVALVLAACGGGDGAQKEALAVSASPQQPVTPAGPAASAAPVDTGAVGPVGRPLLVTVPDYQALRATATVEAPGGTPDAAAMAALVTQNHQMALAHLQAGMAYTNTAAVPPLTYAAVRTLGAAAVGDSLAQFSGKFDLAPSSFVAAQQTGRVESQWWVQRGMRLRTDFFVATDSLGSSPRLASWSAGETGFTEGTASSDPAFTQSLGGADDMLARWAFNTEAPTRLRALVTNSLRFDAAWKAVQPFDGIFAITPTYMVRLPMLRLSAGVTRHTGSDFVADQMKAGDLRIISLRPSGSDFAGFLANRFEAAWRESLAALSASAVPVAGEMLLPQGDLNLSVDADAPIKRAGVTQVFDEINANLRGFDGLGGTYARSYSPGTLRVGAAGLTLQAAHAMAFQFSPKNVHGGSTTTGAGGDTDGQFGMVCTWPQPDLNSFVLAMVDARGWIVSMLTIQAPTGTAVTPECHYEWGFVTGPG